MRNFSSIPILDYSLAVSPSQRPQLILELQSALINVGFLYLSNTPVEQSLVDRLISYIPRLFALPQNEKDKIRMSNSPHFLGYSRFGAEYTKGKVDQREQIDIATPLECRWKPGDFDYLRLWGPSQWPDEALLPGFKETMTEYLSQVETLANNFVRLMAEALGLGPDGLSHFYDSPDKMQHRSKLVQYPAKNGMSESDQGVGAHYDAGFLTILLQASEHAGLQVQNLAGEWIDVPPKRGTFVINFGRALEFATQGIARATSHRVLSPPVGTTTARYSIPFFHNISLDVKIGEADHVLKFPDSILKLRDERGSLAATDSVNFSEFGTETSGQVNLIGRVKSHPDVAERHYPDLFKQIFPDGLPAHGVAY